MRQTSSGECAADLSAAMSEVGGRSPGGGTGAGDATPVGLGRWFGWRLGRDGAVAGGGEAVIGQTSLRGCGRHAGQIRLERQGVHDRASGEQRHWLRGNMTGHFTAMWHLASMPIGLRAGMSARHLWRRIRGWDSWRVTVSAIHIGLRVRG